MNMRIAGAGTIGSGEYDEISISGTGKIVGDVRCQNLSVAGAASVEGKIECVETISCAGSANFKDEVKTKSIDVSGSVKFEKDCIATEEISSAGSIKCMASSKAKIIQLSGYSYVEKDLEAEEICIKGDSQIYGLVNGEKVKIEFDNSLEINEIGGNNIIVLQKEKGINKVKNLPIFKNICKASIGKINTIEGENVAVEFVEANKITGKSVAIGKNCKIKLVQYTDEVEIHPSSTVEQCEKVE